MTHDNQIVYIVDDDAWVRDSLAVMLGVEGFRTQSFAGAQEFLNDYRPAGAGCLLLDVKMPGMSGLELQKALRERGADIPIIVITAHGDVPTARTALISGAVEFLEKPVDPVQLLTAVRAALKGNAARRLEVRRMEEERRKLDILTVRERQVMELVAKGTHYRKIAETLGISPRTVEGHKARMMEKLQVRNVTELVHLVLGALPPGQGGHDNPR